MQEYKDYDFTLTIEDLKRVQQEWQGDITVIVNGMFYELVKEKPEPKKRKQ